MAKVQIDEDKLKKLERAQAKLNALEAGGVDNWEWYGDALKEYSETIELEERMEEMLEDLEVALLTGVYEPSERGAGYCASDEGRREAMKVLQLYKVKFGGGK